MLDQRIRDRAAHNAADLVAALGGATAALEAWAGELTTLRRAPSRAAVGVDCAALTLSHLPHAGAVKPHAATAHGRIRLERAHTSFLDTVQESAQAIVAAAHQAHFDDLAWRIEIKIKCDTEGVLRKTSAKTVALRIAGLEHIARPASLSATGALIAALSPWMLAFAAVDAAKGGSGARATWSAAPDESWAPEGIPTAAAAALGAPQTIRARTAQVALLRRAIWRRTLVGVAPDADALAPTAEDLGAATLQRLESHDPDKVGREAMTTLAALRAG